MALCAKSQRRWTHSYQDYLRLLQNQVVQDVKLLEGGNTGTKTKRRKVTFNKLAHAPDAPKDPVQRLRDMDHIRELTETVGGDMKMSDLDCTSMSLDLIQEVKRGRRLPKDIVEMFEKMEQHPDFYKIGKKAYNIMIHNTTSLQYPVLDTPVAMFGRMLQREGRPTPYTIISLARIEMHLPPIDRPSYRAAFLAELDRNSDLMTPINVKVTRAFLEHLSWVTTGFRMMFYALGLMCSAYLVKLATQYRAEGRKAREILEKEIYTVLDEQYFGSATKSEGGRSSNVIPAKAGVVADDTSDI
eukprot:TRINITY_DN20937_c0_g2_i1.p1 TRINITY_DN20937_c0_g2~~TRINITY_DN20937_c0_g2_i1.p1  ORF type:complete len:300 (+),score=45.00 TRINITY_DN20937_c0_g2_i1:43-942(+)